MRIKSWIIGTATAAATLLAGVGSAFAATYTVQGGQTLWTISQAEHVSISALESANPSVNPADLLVGTALNIPDSSTGASSTSSDAVTSAAYVVQPSDTLWKIAADYGISLNNLLADNPSATAGNLQIGQEIAIPTTSTVAQNLYWMERVIHAEADGETEEAQIGVGDVIANRMANGAYGGDTVADVVFQVISGAYQFTSVENGTIYGTPDAMNIQAAIDVLQDKDDVVPNAYVFFNPSETPANSWVWSQPVIAQIDDFDFAE
ncbi:LysM peptidoglycan-binding domain-containing protein [Alicyclobacillus fodiniaquatilis]|uniref:LysM peptidoglycan-binding domain-containing protein n=1 Tax=Alicyclobacillus fodiniaquatilis TaxID=1661150 RepID=A0ABW4JGV7_9BACL